MLLPFDNGYHENQLFFLVITFLPSRRCCSSNISFIFCALLTPPDDVEIAASERWGMPD